MLVTKEMQATELKRIIGFIQTKIARCTGMRNKTYWQEKLNRKIKDLEDVNQQN